MNREVKYRFWLSHTKKMTNPQTLKDIANNGWDLTDDIIPLEYTGLADRTGNGIYEGDIITIGSRDQLYLVSFNKGSFVAEKIGEKSTILGLRYWLISILVVGNIYENPELSAK